MPVNDEVTVALKLKNAKRFQSDARKSGAAIGGMGKDGAKGAAGIDKANKSTGKLKSGMMLMGPAALSAGAAVGGALVLGVTKSISAFEESRRVTAQTNAVLKSTKGVANVTAKDVDKLTTSLMKKTAIDDEQIRTGANMLLTFTNIRNEQGKNNDIFNQATAIATDMSAALGTDAKSSALQLGKALNDPAKGLTKLQRVGVTFTDQQEKQVEAMVENGNKLGAQKIILKELTKEFGGSAKAQATPLAHLQTTVGNLFETVGGALAPAFDTAMRAANRFILQMVKGKGAGGDFMNVLKVIGRVVAFVVTKILVPYWKMGFKVIRRWVIIVIGIIKVFIAVIRSIVGAAKWAFRAVSNAIKWVKTAASDTWKFVKKTFNSLVGFIGDLPGRIRRGAAGMWEGIKSGLREAINWVIDKFNSIDIGINIKGPGPIPDLKMPDMIPDIPRLARGGITSLGGAVLVGDAGPELLNLPKGAQVTPLQDADKDRVLGSGEPSTIIVQSILDGKVVSESVAKWTERKRARR